MTEERNTLGKRGEEFAADFLIKKGYKIKERNYKSALGEIDIIALNGTTIVFIEVKTRTSLIFGRPFEAVTKKKQRQISKTALYYMSTKKIGETAARFDIVSVISKGEKMEAELIENAFEVAF
ncbi:MAG: YraN family protein [bacterium]|nr:YraN family protein [bacterium]